MITASEPVEFIPHGRAVIKNHPSQIYSKGCNSSWSENSLLYKLTNFAINDDTLLGTENQEDDEMWFVREVKHTTCNDDEANENLTSPEDVKDETSHPLFGPRFNLKDKDRLSAFTVVKPEGRYMGSLSSRSVNNSSNMSKKFDLYSSQNKNSMVKCDTSTTSHFYEEELYVKDCTAVLSKGLISTPTVFMPGPKTRQTIKTYTVEYPITHAVFCDFHTNINNGTLIDALNSQIHDRRQYIKLEDASDLPTEIMPSVLILGSKRMTVYAKSGREFVASIPFQVKKVWPMKYGVLLEKEASNPHRDAFSHCSYLGSKNNSFSRSNIFNASAKSKNSKYMYDMDVPLPTCFSLSHPLDDVTPVIIKWSHIPQYFNDEYTQIIFVSTDPSILLLYDWKENTHSLWYIRKARREECLVVCPTNHPSTTGCSESFNFPGPMSSVSKSTMRNTTAIDPGSYSKKFCEIFSKHNNMTNVFNRQGMVPHHSLGQASSVSMMESTMQQSPPSLPLYPEICFDHIWTDNQAIRRDPIEKPSETKAFLHTDLIGHEYLCFMVRCGISKLHILRLQKTQSNNSKNNILVGPMSLKFAKDAVPLPRLKMIALIDETGNIMLYTGTYIVGKVHVGGVLARLIDSPYSKPNLQSPFPRRSSLLPTRANDPAAFDDSALHLLSPVPHLSETLSMRGHHNSLGLQGLCDPAGNRMTLRFDKGLMYRITLPPISCSPLVARCCNALIAILPKDECMQTLIKWYGIRNAPGTQGLTFDQEWKMFSNLLYSMMGYNLERMSSPASPDSESASEVVTKKQRTSGDGTHGDWEYLLTTKMHKSFESSVSPALNLPKIKFNAKAKRRRSLGDEKSSQFNTNSLLFHYMSHILYAFHLAYEDTKLNTLLLNEMIPLSTFLFQLAKDLRLQQYTMHYWIDLPTVHMYDIKHSDRQLTELQLKKIAPLTYFKSSPPHFFSYLRSMLRAVNVGHYPHLDQVNDMSRDIIEVMATMGAGRYAGVDEINVRDHMAASSTPLTRQRDGPPQAPNCKALAMLNERGITASKVSHMPPAVSLVILEVMESCRSSPMIGWPPECYDLAMRPELRVLAEMANNPKANDKPLTFQVLDNETAFSLPKPVEPDPVASISDEKEVEVKTGLEHVDSQIMSLLYPQDHRLSEVVRLLQSAHPVTISKLQGPDVSDHDFIEEQEKILYAFSTRTMALPIARGMVTLCTTPCVPSEPVTVPRLNVSGRGPPPRSVNIELHGANAESRAASLAWPCFHNGAAAGLALVPGINYPMHSCWIMADKFKGSQVTPDISNEHAGFVMALGINGHLRGIPFMTVYDYLIRSQEMLSVGLLLGLAANYRGTMDIQVTKLMGIHLEPLLPSTAIDLDIHQNILVAALMGIGLIYQGSRHAHYANVLLGEIVYMSAGKPPWLEAEKCVEREGYTLAAGLALGFVLVGAGDEVPPYYSHVLRMYMLGGEKHPVTGFHKDKYQTSTFAFCDNNTVNLDVTSPGATLALGLIYLKTGNKAIAGWLAPPETSYMLDFVRPDLLMLRCIARGLILWTDVQPDEEWVESQVPDTIKPYCLVRPTDDTIDYEAMNQAYCNIVGGACFTIGLRYAGTGNEDAKETLLHYANLFITLTGKSVGELAGRSTLEACLCVCILAAGMVMTGRGDLEVMKIIRRVRTRLPLTKVSAKRPALTHGGQMAVHCALGLLFLGGGRLSLSRTGTSIAALLAAFFPKFPVHSEDNRYHLQALRHLYVLAVEPRLILPRDLNTGKLCYAHLQVLDVTDGIRHMRAPCLLPELSKLREVRVSDPSYWPIVFQRGRNWDQLCKIIANTWCIDVKQRSSFLSYGDDQEGILSIIRQTLTLENTNVWSVTPENIEFFTSDDKLKIFMRNYLMGEEEPEICKDCYVMRNRKLIKLKFSRSDFLKRPSYRPRRKRIEKKKYSCKCRKESNEDLELINHLNLATYDCVVKDILCVLPVWTTFLKILRSLHSEMSAYHVWQVRLLNAHVEWQAQRFEENMRVDEYEASPADSLIATEFAVAMHQKLAAILDEVVPSISRFLRKYLGLPSCAKIDKCDETVKKNLSAFAAYYGLKRGALLGHSSNDYLLSFMLNTNADMNTISKIESLII